MKKIIVTIMLLVVMASMFAPTKVHAANESTNIPGTAGMAMEYLNKVDSLKLKNEDEKDNGIRLVVHELEDGNWFAMMFVSDVHMEEEEACIGIYDHEPTCDDFMEMYVNRTLVSNIFTETIVTD